MSKKIIFLPLIALSMVVTSEPEISNIILGDNSVYVIYDAGEGQWEDGQNIKTFKVRRGIKWNRRTNREKPEGNPSIVDDDSLDFSAYLYDGKELTDDESSFVIDQDMIVTAKYIPARPTGDPATESWTVLANYCNGPKAAMDLVYKNWLTEHNNTYVGAERSLRVNNNEYTVRIIGVDHDSTNLDGTEKARLTFEFVDEITNVAYDTTKNVYEKSTIRNFLNVDLFSLIEQSARKYIKPVYKVTNKGDGANVPGGGGSVGILGKTQEKLFPLSLSEMDAEHIKEETGIEFYDAFEKEGEAYEYYDNLSGVPTSLIKHPLNKTTPQAYWTRSPEVSTSSFAWQIESDGKIGKISEDYFPYQDPNVIYEDLTVAPCFCI